VRTIGRAIQLKNGSFSFNMAYFLVLFSI